MANSIAASTRAYLDSLDVTVREAAEAAVRANSVRVSGLELSLEEELNLAKAVKFVAGADGVSVEELTALKFLMIMASIPNELQKHVVDHEAVGGTLDDVGRLFPPASHKAAYVLSGATTVAAVDGLSAEEETKARQLGAGFGLETALCDALIAHARAMGLAMSRGDRELVEELERLRVVLLSRV
ncbi:MAG: hypothetical protein K0V04_34235 [Deltaproteobacteria bacterium]|nr:hypothetical protein [Deltaproteobacteria bacterium]